MKRFRLITRMAGITACLSVLTACAIPSQMYWDAKVKALCEKDGGITIYRTVEIKKSAYKLIKEYDGSVRAPEIKYINKNIDIFYSVTKTDVINENNPVVYRNEQKIYRIGIDEIIGVEVSYSRIGADVHGYGHPGSYSCGDIPDFKTNINKLIYTVKGE